ncbi:MAG: hypothetical protein JO307_16925 [Bryobacterales bacterium]|nr:hypothetical protein [Bryobacterales bacterium]MBV9397922.1 hypothetical protein [Bryobacterales bacterium]
MADQKGSGKHPHRSGEEPYSHTKKQGSSGQKSSGTAVMDRDEEQQESSKSGENMKGEHRDSKSGQQTKTSEEHHKGGKKSKSS